MPPVDFGRAGPAWLDAFAGIEYTVAAGAEHRVVGDLPDVVGPRLRNRIDSESVRIPIRALYDIAKRIEAQSQRIVELEGGIGEMIDQSAVDAWEAERSAMKTGVACFDNASGEAVLYGSNGDLAHADSCEAVQGFIEEEGWGVTVFDAPGLLERSVPDTLVDFQHAFGAHLRARRAEEIRQATGRVVEGSATLTPAEAPS